MIEKFLATYKLDSTYYFYVRWAKPYSDPSHDTWEPESSLRMDIKNDDDWEELISTLPLIYCLPYSMDCLSD